MAIDSSVHRWSVSICPTIEDRSRASLAPRLRTALSWLTWTENKSMPRMVHRDATNIDEGENELGWSLPLQPPGTLVAVATVAMSDNGFFPPVPPMWWGDHRASRKSIAWSLLFNVHHQTGRGAITTSCISKRRRPLYPPWHQCMSSTFPETTNVGRKQYSKSGTIPRYGKNLRSPTEIVSRSPSPATLISPSPLTPMPTWHRSPHWRQAAPRPNHSRSSTPPTPASASGTFCRCAVPQNVPSLNFLCSCARSKAGQVLRTHDDCISAPTCSINELRLHICCQSRELPVVEADRI